MSRRPARASRKPVPATRYRLPCTDSGIALRTNYGQEYVVVETLWCEPVARQLAALRDDRFPRWSPPSALPSKYSPPARTGKPSRGLTTLRGHLVRLSVGAKVESDRELAKALVADIDAAIPLFAQEPLPGMVSESQAA